MPVHQQGEEEILQLRHENRGLKQRLSKQHEYIEELEGEVLPVHHQGEEEILQLRHEKCGLQKRVAKQQEFIEDLEREVIVKATHIEQLGEYVTCMYSHGARTTLYLPCCGGVTPAAA